MNRTLSGPRAATLLGDFPTSPAYRGLADGLRRLIADGRIPVSTRLPSERDLTAALGVSRTTVTRAYQLLRELGYASARQGSRTVAALPVARGHRGDHLLTPAGGGDDDLDLTCAASVAPAGMSAAFEAAVAELPSYLGGNGYFPSGLPALREALAARFAARGLPTSPSQIIVTAGALGGLAIAARAVTATGDRVLVESPTYPNAIATLQHAGCRIAGVDVDVHGWDIDSMAAALRQVAPRAVYLIPDFHHPTGALLPAEQRAELGAALRASRTAALIDESMVDVPLEEQTMPPPLGCFVPDSITIGSASKSFWGGLRIGWLRVPDSRSSTMIAARLSLDLGAPVLEQLVLLQLLASENEIMGWRRAQLRASRDALMAALQAELPSWTVTPPRGGLAIWAELSEPVSSTLTSVAERHGLLLASGPSFAPEGGLERHLRLPYTLPPASLVQAVRRLRLAWDETLTNGTAHPGRRTLVA